MPVATGMIKHALVSTSPASCNACRDIHVASCKRRDEPAALGWMALRSPDRPMPWPVWSSETQEWATGPQHRAQHGTHHTSRHMRSIVQGADLPRLLCRLRTRLLYTLASRSPTPTLPVCGGVHRARWVLARRDTSSGACSGDVPRKLFVSMAASSAKNSSMV